MKMIMSCSKEEESPPADTRTEMDVEIDDESVDSYQSHSESLYSFDEKITCPLPQRQDLITKEDLHEMKRQQKDGVPLVLPEEKECVIDYLFVALEQLISCKLVQSDLYKGYKMLEIGYPGMACKHCIGQPYNGRFFPQSKRLEAYENLILKHLINCQECPLEVREVIETKITANLRIDKQKNQRIEKSRNKTFLYNRIWCRMHDLPIDSINEASTPNKKIRGLKPISTVHFDELKRQKEEALPLVSLLPSEKYLARDDLLYLTFEQMETCKFTDFDRSRFRSVEDQLLENGFPGLACKHCVVSGRYFPKTRRGFPRFFERIANHVNSCPECPSEVREKMENLIDGRDIKNLHKECHAELIFDTIWFGIRNNSALDDSDHEVTSDIVGNDTDEGKKNLFLDIVKNPSSTIRAISTLFLEHSRLMDQQIKKIQEYAKDPQLAHRELDIHNINCKENILRGVSIKNSGKERNYRIQCDPKQLSSAARIQNIEKLTQNIDDVRKDLRRKRKGVEILNLGSDQNKVKK